MSEAAAVCEHCGAPLLSDAFFCGDCGKSVVPPRNPVRKQTVLGGLPAMSVPRAAPTLDGGTTADEERERTTDVGLSEPPVGQMGRTMLGMPQPKALDPRVIAAGGGVGAGAGVAAPASQAAPAGTFAKTMLGLPQASAAAAAAVAAESAAAAVDKIAPAATPGSHARTLIGGLDSAAVAQAVAAADRQAAKSGTADTSRTLLGLEDGAPAVAEKAAVPARTSRTGDRPSNERASGERSRISRPSSDIILRRGTSYAVFGLSALALGAAVALGYLALVDRAPNVSVRVVTDQTGESMLFEVPGSGDGAKLRFGGQEKVLEAGRASFALGGDSLRVGKNRVLFDIVQKDGSAKSGHLTLAVDYRVTIDTAPLRSGKPAVDVVVSAVPGSKVWLDGEPVALDAEGRAVRTDALEPGTAAGRTEHVVHYRVQPASGEATVGELRTSIPVTTMQIDRPGALVVTDRDSVEIAGAVDKDARVTIDGTPVSVVGDRFLYRYPLPHAGDYLPRVVATADGKAPRSSALLVQRVDDLAKAAEGFAPDASLTYAKIVQNPAIYRGQRVAFEGRVYNVNVEAGRSVLQVLVRECPRGERCPIWVSYSAATELTVDSWVRVLGILQGEQQFRAESDEVRTVPKVDAVFLLPLKR
jgi:hypothetical protein